MEQLAAFDLYTLIGLMLAGFLALCAGILYLLRDTESAPPRAVTRWLWCSDRGQLAVVDFTEEVTTGITMRRIEHCSLLGAGERCAGHCRYATVRAPHSVASTAVRA